MRVLPGAKKNDVLGVFCDGSIKVKIRDRPVEHAANMGLIDFISEYFKIKRSQVILEKGIKSRKKILRLQVDSKKKNEILEIIQTLNPLSE